MTERPPNPELDAAVRKVVSIGLGVIFLAVCVAVALVIVVATWNAIT